MVRDGADICGFDGVSAWVASTFCVQQYSKQKFGIKAKTGSKFTMINNFITLNATALLNCAVSLLTVYSA